MVVRAGDSRSRSSPIHVDRGGRKGMPGKPRSERFTGYKRGPRSGRSASLFRSGSGSMDPPDNVSLRDLPTDRLSIGVGSPGLELGSLDGELNGAPQPLPFHKDKDVMANFVRDTLPDTPSMTMAISAEEQPDLGKEEDLVMVEVRIGRNPSAKSYTQSVLMTCETYRSVPSEPVPSGEPDVETGIRSAPATAAAVVATAEGHPQDGSHERSPTHQLPPCAPSDPSASSIFFDSVIRHVARVLEAVQQRHPSSDLLSVGAAVTSSRFQAGEAHEQQLPTSGEPSSSDLPGPGPNPAQRIIAEDVRMLLTSAVALALGPGSLLRPEVLGAFQDSGAADSEAGHQRDIGGTDANLTAPGNVGAQLAHLTLIPLLAGAASLIPLIRIRQVALEWGLLGGVGGGGMGGRGAKGHGVGKDSACHSRGIGAGGEAAFDDDMVRCRLFALAASAIAASSSSSSLHERPLSYPGREEEQMIW